MMAQKTIRRHHVSNPCPTLPTSVIRDLDRRTIERGVPGLILMENAGLRCADLVAERFTTGRHDGVWLVCGKGNNAGDGFVIARHLANRGLPCRLTLLGDADSFDPASDAGVNLTAARASGIEAEAAPGDPSDAVATLAYRRPLVVDALLGTGLRGALREPFSSWVAALNDLGHAILAVDVPSGLDSDTGEVLGCAIRANTTVTFAAAKPGFFRAAGPEHVGELHVVDISIPRALLHEALRQNPA